MKTKFAFVFLCLIFLLNIDALGNDLKWFVTQYNSTENDLTKISNNREYLILGEYTPMIKIIKCRDGKLVSAIEKNHFFDNNGQFICYDFSTDNNNVYLIREKQIQIFSINTAELINKYEFIENGINYTFKYIAKPKKKNFFVGLGTNISEPQKNKLITWDADSFKIINSIDIDIDTLFIYSLNISDDGSLVHIGLNEEGSFTQPYSTKNLFYNLNENQFINEIDLRFDSFQFSNEYLLYCTPFTYKVNKIVMLNSSDFSIKKEIYCFDSRYSSSNQFDISKDSKFLLYINQDNSNQLDVFNLESNEVEYSMNPYLAGLDKFYFFNEDTVIVESVYDYTSPTIELVKGKTNSYIRQIANGRGKATNFCFTKDNKYLWVFFDYGSISKYELESGKLVDNIDYGWEFEHPSMAVSDENYFIAYAGKSDFIRIINFTDSTYYNLNEDNSEFFSLSFSSDNKLLSASSGTNSVILWDVINQTKLKSIEVEYDVCFTFFSNDEQYVYIVAKNGEYSSILYKWYLSTNELTSKELNGFKSNDEYMSVSKDKRYISSQNAVYDIIEDEIYGISSSDYVVIGNSVSNSNNYIALTNGWNNQDGNCLKVIDWKSFKTIKDYSFLKYINYFGYNAFYEYKSAYQVQFSNNSNFIALGSAAGGFALFKFDTTSTLVEDNQETNTLEAKVFPNPASNIVNLDLSLPSSGVVNVTIRDVQGVAVIENYSEYFVSGKANIPFNLPKLASGMYYVTVSFNTETTTIPLIIIN